MDTKILKKYVLCTLLLTINLIVNLTGAEIMDEAKTKYLKDYKPSEFSVENINLTIDLRDDHALVTNDFTVRAVPGANPKTIKLDGTNQELVSVEVDGKALSKDQYQLTKEYLSIPVNSADFRIKVQSKIMPLQNTALEGLYESDGLFLTQCEPFGFRNITYFLDRPDVMTVYTTKLIADKKYPVLLSNGDVLERGDIGANRHFVTWHDKSKKPSYLFAAVLGDLQVKKDSFKTMSGRDIALEIYVPEKDITKVDYAMSSLKAAMKWDENVFDREYDLNTYMIVGTNKFNSGAMENKGLNIFNTKYILADKDIATDTNYKAVRGVIGHEYFHNWTGNRITLRNWFQLSIKEGLTVFRDQEFSSDEFDRATQRIEDADTIRSVQFEEDGGPLSHSVRPESYISMNNFYTTTVYEKGAEVARMLKTILGDKTFRKAMDLYFDKYDGHAVIAEDFVQAMQDGSGIDLKQFKLWYSQAGTPVVEATGEYNASTKTYTLKCKQIYKHTEKQKNNLPFFIPIKIGFIGSESGDELKFKYLEREQSEVVLHLTKEEQIFVFNDVKEAPLPSILRDFSAPVKLKFPYTNAQLLWLMAHDTNDFNRWDAGQSYMLEEILTFMKSIKAGEEPQVSSELVNAFREILNSSKLTKEFICVALVLPSESIVYDRIKDIDPRLVFNARKALATQICKALKEDLLNMYNRLNTDLKSRAYSLTREDMASRSLKNLCIMDLSYADSELGGKLAEAQLDAADNLTDRLPSFRILVDSKDSAVSNKAITEFYAKWKHEDLIVDRWLSMQSFSDRSDTVQLVANLMNHEAFDMKIPNKIYALLGAFAANNDKFHSPDGSGYKLYGDFIIKLDPINPMIAARIAKAFDTWAKFEPGRRAMMSKVIANIKSQSKISSNLKEIMDTIS